MNTIINAKINKMITESKIITQKNVLWEAYKTMNYIEKRAFREAYINEFEKNFNQFYKIDVILNLQNLTVKQLAFFAAYLPVEFHLSPKTKYKVKASLTELTT